MRRTTKRLLKLYTVAILLFLYLPIAMVVIFSFNDSAILGQWRGFTLRWYDDLFANEGIWRALQNSLVIGAATAAISAVLGTLAAYGITRFRMKGAWAFEAFFLIPVIIPEIAEALSILLFFAAVGWRLSLVTVIVGHAAFGISFVYLVVRARLSRYNLSMDEAAKSLGASSLQTFFRITLPMSLPGIVAGTLLAFTVSFDDYLKTRFTIGAAGQTLPLIFFSQAARGGVSPELSALATIMLAVSLALALERVLSSRIQALRRFAGRILRLATD
jgi:spermidine/putrescine transport system permease protein